MKRLLAVLLLSLVLVACGCNNKASHTQKSASSQAVGDLQYQYDAKTETLTIQKFGTTINYEQTAKYDELCRIERPVKVVIAKGVTAIPKYFFRYATDNATGNGQNHFNQIKSVVIPDTVTKIGDNAFNCCYGLESVSIPDSVKRIGTSAFADCNHLKSVKLGKGLRTVSFSAFKRCEQLSNIAFSDSVTKISDEAFSYCTALKSVKLPASVKAVGEKAFSNCYALAAVALPAQLKTIGSFAFYDCPPLKSVTIPQSVKTIRPYAFGYIAETADDEETVKEVLNNGFVIKGVRGSAAEKYAQENSVTFVS